MGDCSGQGHDAERLPLGGGRREVTSSALRATLDCDGREVHVDVVRWSGPESGDRRREGVGFARRARAGVAFRG
jgi:hypothetical protein